MLQSARAAGERVFDILDATEEGSAPSPRRTGALREPVRGEVRYEEVGFSYGNGRTALQQICLEARPGQMIALVGPTGSGKSTLVNLLPAFYEATSGRILIDGQDTAGLSLDSLRARISVVSQEAFLFNGTVRENILYGKLDATEEELLAASARRQLPRLHRPPARRLRLARGRARRQTERGRKTAREHRPRAFEKRPHPHT